MFGLIKDKNHWDFAVFGKHPAAGDYLSLGHVTPLLNGYSSWMEKGYGQVAPGLKDTSDLAWKFWAKGPNGKLICGILKNSRDKHNRPYPLMVTGEGRLPEAAREWDLIPFALEKTWALMKGMGGQGAESIKDLKRILSKIKGPSQSSEKWRKAREQVKGLPLPLARPGMNSDFMNKMNNVDGLSRKDHVNVWIDVGKPVEAMIPVSKFLILMKTRTKIEPGTVFIGGGKRIKRMVLLRRSLAMDDFTDLWITRHPEEDL